MRIILLIMCICSLQMTAFSQWTEVNTPPLSYFHDSYFINDSIAFILGPNSILYKTEDSGQAWDSIGTPYIYSWLNTAHFIDDQTGFVGGGANFPFPPSSISDLILKTNDGGLTWDSIYGTQSGSDIIDIDFADLDNGMFVSSYVSYKTSDGGVTIDTLGLNFNNTLNYGREIEFPDLDHAYAISYQNNTGPNANDLFILKSTNQGDDWQVIVLENTPSYSTKIDFVSGDTGFMIAQGSRFFSTTDGANNWTKLQLDTSLTFTDVQFVDEQLGFLCAFKDSTSYLYTTQNGGANWVIEEIDSNVRVNFIHIGDDYIYANNNKHIFKRSIASFQVGIKEVNALHALHIHPNPCSDKLTFEWTSGHQNHTLNLTNNLGQVVRTQAVEAGNNKLNLHGLASGIYTLSIHDGDKTLTFSRVMKK